MIKIILHINLAFAVFLSSGGFGVYDHYCKNEFKGSSYFFNLKNCCDGEDQASCKLDKIGCTSNEDDGESDDCCQNKLKFFKSDQNQIKQGPQLSNNEKLPSWNIEFLPFEIKHFAFGDFTKEIFLYVPPPIIFDRQIYLQTFLC